MINRSDCFSVSGGDTVQMIKTRLALQKLGVDSEACTTQELEGVTREYDLVHVFNLQTAEESWLACQWARRNGLPVAHSPIYWNPLPIWFQEAPNRRRVWRWVRSACGRRLGLVAYSVWQRLRYPSQETWQIQRKLLDSVDIVLPNSYAELNQLKRDFRLGSAFRSRCSVVPNAVDVDLFEPRPRPLETLPEGLEVGKFVLQVGRVSPEKNNLCLIESLSDLDVPIVFIGQASHQHAGYLDLCRQRAAERGRVHFIDWIQHENLPRIYASAAVHVLPSWRETPGLASLEAAAAGCPIVSTSIGSAREYFGDEAWYCDPGDRRSIRRAVLAALQVRPSQALRRRILKEYSWDAAARSTRNAYMRMLGLRTRVPGPQQATSDRTLKTSTPAPVEMLSNHKGRTGYQDG